MRTLGVGRHAAVMTGLVIVLLCLALSPTVGCGGSSSSGSGSDSESKAADSSRLTVIAAESFLADITKNVAGDKMEVESLVPAGADPHGFELTPADAARVARCDVLVLNGTGLEAFLEDTMDSIGGDSMVIEASAGLSSRVAREGEEVAAEDAESEHEDGDHQHDEGDPHYWLDPILVVKYVENIRDGLCAADPTNAAAYQANAAAYITSLGELDVWIKEKVAEIPPAERLLVTNHESLGYFADRYGFKVIGTIMPSVSADSSPSAQQLAQLIAAIREAEVKAIFLETGSNSQLAEQVASETGVRVVVDLYTHSLTDSDGPAPTYIDMMKADTTAIVDALK
jgi:ABC-type Zn uptake system ZnuABC Zn-binding protein ZnuA